MFERYIDFILQPIMIFFYISDIAHRQVALKLRANEARRHMCLIPETGLPPIIKSTSVKGGKICTFKLILMHQRNNL